MMTRCVMPLMACVFTLLTSGRSSAQHQPEPRVLGGNLASIVDWQSQFAFIDVFKAAREWIPQHEPDDGTWDTGETIETDSNGWVMSLAPGQAAATVLLTGQRGNYPEGEYVCLYDGIGTIEFGLDAQVIDAQPGRLVVYITPSPDGLSLLRITQTDPADPVRNIRLFMPGFEQHAGTILFHPLFVQSLRPYQVLRFMDWQRTNNSPLISWDERTTPATFSQATDRGVALEYMIELCNLTRKHAWFCVPHQADDAYVVQMATMIRDQLDPSLKVYIEYSNEVWNGIFAQHAYAEQQGLAMGLSNDPWEASYRFHAQQSVEVFTIFAQVFGGTDRIVRVMGGWSASPWTNQAILDWNNASAHTDALGTAPYFGGDLGGLSAEQLHQIGVDAFLDIIEAELNDPQGSPQAEITENTAIATAEGIGHITYEGGQHMVYFNDPDDTQITNLLVAANRSPRMRGLYNTYFDLWNEKSGGQLMTHFTHIAEPGKFGSWGALESQMQEPTTAYKWLAINDFAKRARTRYPRILAPLP